VRRNALEQFEQVVDVGHEVGEDDVVERLAEVELLAGDRLEAELRMLVAAALDHLRADVDPDAVGGLEPGEQVARAAADLEHAGARRDVEPHQLADEAVVGRVPALPPGLLFGEPVEEGDELGVGIGGDALLGGDRGGHRSLDGSRAE
jgi:hypothetical protein